VRRSDAVSFMPGFHAFVGGLAGPDDPALPLEGTADERGRTLRACAVREAFEEIGVLLAREGQRDAATLEEARERLLCGEATFGALAKDCGWRFHAGDLPDAGRWMTPPFSSVRVDASYFLARLPEGQSPSIDDSELADGEWITAAAAIERWRRGEVTIAAPILHTLQAIAEGEDGLARRLVDAPARAGTPPRIELKWGIVLHPMKTKPLPPATHTNAYLVGDDRVALIDPGSGEPAELEALESIVARLAADGRTLDRILLTHAHPDHIGGVAALRERHGVPVFGHAAIADTVRLDGTLKDGDVVALPSRDGWDLEVIHTPGHARGHLCFFHRRTRSLLCGDHIVGLGTVIIDPPEGDMADYIASLERLAGLGVETLFPAHGSPQGAAPRRIRALIAHRLERERKVAEALDGEPRSLAALVERAYADTSRELWPYAERSLLAHLLKLEREGRAVRTGETWRRTTSS